MGRSRVFIDKEHQLTWMHARDAREIAALRPTEDKQRDGRIASVRASQFGRLADAAVKGGARSHEIAEELRVKSR